MRQSALATGTWKQRHNCCLPLHVDELNDPVQHVLPSVNELLLCQSCIKTLHWESLCLLQRREECPECICNLLAVGCCTHRDQACSCALHGEWLGWEVMGEGLGLNRHFLVKSASCKFLETTSSVFTWNFVNKKFLKLVTSKIPKFFAHQIFWKIAPAHFPNFLLIKFFGK